MSIHLSQMIPASSTFSVEAEKKLLVYLLDSSLFKYTDEVHRHLAIYPNTNFFLKENIIKKLMDSLWGVKGLFDVFGVFDNLLGAVNKRGHYVHQFEVFLLGINFILLSSRMGKDINKVYKFNKIDSVFYAWLFASSAHDFGYSIEASNKIFNKISEMYSAFGFDSIASKINGDELAQSVKDSEELKKIKTEILGGQQTTDIREIVFDCLENTLTLERSDLETLQEKLEGNLIHGYVGSIILYRYLSSALGDLLPLQHFEDNWVKDTTRYVIGSICSHGFNENEDPEKDFSDYISSISFDKNPYAYLLFVFDNLQDWNRDLVVTERWPTYCLSEFRADDEAGVYFLQYAVKHRTWSFSDLEKGKVYDVRNDVRSNIENKRKIIELAGRPTEKLGVTIHIDFQINCDLDIPPIILEV